MRRASASLPVVASLVFSACFIARTAFTVDNDTYFTLFDDAMISMRYARNFAEGAGLVWNAGEAPVEGYTNFLWTVWMAVLHLLPVPVSKTSLLVMISGAIVLAVNVLIVRELAAHLAPESPRAASLAAWLTALYYPLSYWTLRGMEVGLITLILSGCVLLALRLRDRFSRRDLFTLGVVFALGLLTRPDFAAPAVAIAGFALWTARHDDRRRIAMVLGGAVAGTLVLHTAFRLLYYGAPLPNTYYLKVHGAALGTRLARGLVGLAGFSVLHLAVPLVAASCLMVKGRTTRSHPGLFLLAGIFLALCAYSAYVGGDVWDSMRYANRYVTPGVPGLMVLAALGIDRLLFEQSPPRQSAILGLAGLFLLVGILNFAVPPSAHALPATAADERLRIANAAITLAPILVLPLLRVPANARRHAGVFAAVAVASLVAVNGEAMQQWFSHNAFYVDDDASAARYGLALKDATAADASIAVTWAGAIPYFSQRPAIDLLGKSDRVIATRPRQTAIPFYPGHDKWDYAYSIGERRPDVVAQLWQATNADLAAIESWGYVPLAPWVFARADSTRIDRAAVKAAGCVMLRENAFVLGSPTRVATDLEGWLARYCAGPEGRDKF